MSSASPNRTVAATQRETIAAPPGQDKTQPSELTASQAQKLEVLGQLAGGVAHDFNNIITAVLGSAEILEFYLGAELAKQPAAREALDQIHDAAQRAANLTRQLLTYSRPDEQRSEPTCVNRVVEDMQTLLRRLLPTGIEMRIELADDLPPTDIDAAHLEQVIMNLAINARDAMGHSGELTIRTLSSAPPTTSRSNGIGNGRRHAPGHADPPREVILAVCDTGCGMDAATQRRVFEPFFTTKARGRGTGLGLAMTQAFLHQAGGRIEIQSAPGAGSIFRVYLPAAHRATASKD